MESPQRTRSLRHLGVEQMDIEDEAEFRKIALYGKLKRALQRDGYQFAIMPTATARWDHALLLNLSYWQARGGGDVMVDDVLPADVLCHVAWHHLAGAALAESDLPLSAEALALGESIASAFDLYLVGRLAHAAPDCGFIATQVPAMLDAADAAGCADAAFAVLLQGVCDDPEGSFESLRQLLYDALLGLLAAPDADAGLGVLVATDRHRFGPLLHHYELSNWLQHARAAPHNASAQRARDVDVALRAAPVSLDWLQDRWLSAAAPTAA